MERSREKWQSEYARLAGKEERKARFETDSFIPVKPLYTPEDLEAKGFSYDKDLGYPGEYPNVRGVDPLMYRKSPWAVKQYVGYATVEESNKLYKYLISQGQQKISIAYHLPAQVGLDSDNPLARGEVGKIGVAVDSLEDMEKLLEGINLEEVMVSSVANAQASVAIAFQVGAAEKRGMDSRKLSGLVQGDILKEYYARGNYIFPLQSAMRLFADTAAYCVEHLPNFIPLQICPYHIREAGANAIQEVAFSLGNAIAYMEKLIERNVAIDSIAPRINCLITGRHRDFLEEIAKIRAMRKLWAKIMKERFGARDPRSYRLSFWQYEGGIGFTSNQLENNIVRATLAALAGALAGVQDMGLCTIHEAIGIPSQKALQIAIRTQHIVAHETGVTNTIDPLGGSYYLEWLTMEIEERVEQYLRRIDEMGGMIRAIETGFVQREMLGTGYNHYLGEESADRVVIGVNKFTESDDEEEPRVYDPDPQSEEREIEKLRLLRQKRNNTEVIQALDGLRRAADARESNENNLMPHIIRAVRAYTTIGEICGALKDVFGLYHEPKIM